MGTIREFWFAGSDNLAFERSQRPVQVFGKVAACTSAAKRGRAARATGNIMM